MKPFWHLTVFSLLVLAFAAVWLGGLNQDEGWYLYAANLVAEGQMPYRDFFYTQAPLLPLVYSAFSGIWARWGLLGGRVFTLSLGLVSILFLVGLARRLSSPGKRSLASLLVAIVLCGNLYHLYYLAIPKTYALASLFVAIGFYVLSYEGPLASTAAGLCLAFACASRVSLGAMLPVVAGGLFLVRDRFGRSRRDWLWFGAGATAAMILVFGPFLNGRALSGLIAAQAYHTSRVGLGSMLAVGSLSRLVRWYMPLFVLFGLGVYAAACGRRCEAAFADLRRRLTLALSITGFLVVFILQMMAPVPYEDYNVPIMGLLAVSAAVLVSDMLEVKPALLALATLGMTWAATFGSPLLQEWTTNGKDRFWVKAKTRSELAQLREVAREINELDPGGRELLTQDLYLAIETGRKVPRQMAMGPFSFWSELPYDGAEDLLLDDAGMRALLEGTECKIVAMSGYSFAITSPRGEETPIARQIEYWNILKRRYDLVFTEDGFGQGATPLMVLRRKDARKEDGGTPVR